MLTSGDTENVHSWQVKTAWLQESTRCSCSPRNRLVSIQLLPETDSKPRFRCKWCVRKWTQEKCEEIRKRSGGGKPSPNVISGKVPVSACYYRELWSINCIPEFVSSQAKGFGASNTVSIGMDATAGTYSYVCNLWKACCFTSASEFIWPLYLE